MDIVARIDHWAAVAPQQVAHISGPRQISYEELRSRSDALANFLQNRLGDDGSPVAVLGQREPEMLIGFLGAVKAGHAYLPIDPDWPRRRISRVISTAGVNLILIPAEIASRSGASRSTAPLLREAPRPEDPFYILFTSGSSGEPKGVVITHGCLSHFLKWMTEEQRFSDLAETFLNQAPFSFDLSVMDLYCSLTTGGTLLSIGRDLVAQPRLLYRAFAESSLTTWVSTPSFAQFCLAERTFDQKMLPGLQRFLFCGETLARDTAVRLREQFPNAEIWNTYGPTEATVATTSIQITDAILNRYRTLPVGRPMPGTDVFVADEQGQALPPGTSGQIIIAGPNVSPGYINAPGLTNRSFYRRGVHRAYRTGDWGCCSNDMLFFEGRIDRQTKINGYRIELEDIESNLRDIDGVRDAAVVPVQKNEKTISLTAFVILDEFQTAEATALTSQLRKSLNDRVPSYMMPRRIVLVDAFPLTANGKTDRRQLTAML